MSLTGLSQVFLVGFIGGLILEVIHWYNLRRKTSFPKYVRSISYWVITIVMAAVGGLLAVLYFGDNGDGLVTLHIGLSAPLILQNLVKTVAPIPGARGPELGLVDFCSW